jgi:hypothetical protein
MAIRAWVGSPSIPITGSFGRGAFIVVPYRS